MASYLVTGAAGFIGSALAKKLLEAKHEVVVIDNLSTGFRENIPEGCIVFEEHCQDESLYDRLPQREYEAIYHIAGQSSGEISFDNPVYDLQTNAQSTLLLLKFALKMGCKKFLYAGTMSIYGDQPDVPVHEMAPTFPKSFYGVGKLASEHYLRIYAQYGVSCTSLRLFNVYGPGQNMDNLRQGMVSIYLAQAIRSRHMQVKGSPERFRDFVYIDDVVRAFQALEANCPLGFSAYNVATGVKTRVFEVVEAIQSLLPFEVTVEFCGTTPGDQHGIVADCTKIADDIGWRARTQLAEGLEHMVAWALNN